MLSVLLWALLGLLALVVLVLATPVLIRIDGRAGPERSLRVALSLFGGLVPPIVVTGDGRKGRGAERSGQQADTDKLGEHSADLAGRKARKKPKKTSRRNGGRMIRAVPRLIGDVLRKVQVRELVLDAEFGLGDPAETGEVFGMMVPLLYGIPSSERIVLAVRPNFGDRMFAGRIGALIRFTPLAFVPPALRFGWVAFGPER